MNFTQLGLNTLSKSLTGFEFDFSQTLSIHMGIICTYGKILLSYIKDIL